MRPQHPLRTLPRGFTLLELLIVISIIAILATLGFVIYGRAVEQAKRVKATMQVHAIAEAANQYFQELGEYPPDTGPYEPADQPSNGLSADQARFAIYRYLGVELQDKKTGQIYGPYLRDLSDRTLGTETMEVDGVACQLYIDPWGEPYQLDCTHWIRDPRTRLVTVSKPYPGNTPEDLQTLDIKAWSKGPDKKDTPEAPFYPILKNDDDNDNIMSWQGKGK